jgi:hypothetical protein
MCSLRTVASVIHQSISTCIENVLLAVVDKHPGKIRSIKDEKGTRQVDKPSRRQKSDGPQCLM